MSCALLLLPCSIFKRADGRPPPAWGEHISRSRGKKEDFKPWWWNPICERAGFMIHKSCWRKRGKKKKSSSLRHHHWRCWLRAPILASTLCKLLEYFLLRDWWLLHFSVKSDCPADVVSVCRKIQFYPTNSENSRRFWGWEEFINWCDWVHLSSSTLFKSRPGKTITRNDAIAYSRVFTRLYSGNRRINKQIYFKHQTLIKIIFGCFWNSKIQVY